MNKYNIYNIILTWGHDGPWWLWIIIHVYAVLLLFGMAKEGHEHQSHPGPVGSINLGISATCGNHGMSTLDIPRLISFGVTPKQDVRLLFRSLMKQTKGV